MKTDDSNILRLENLTKRFGTTLAVDNVSLSVEKGDKIVIVGPSGSGKSTLLRSINILEEIDSGRIIFKGEPVGYVEKKGKLVPDHPKKICALRSKIGMVFQNFNLFPHMTVLENVMEGPLTVLKHKKKTARETARAMLEKVGLSNKADVFPATLSGGQQQRVGIARALAMKPDIMLFDEPTSALDPELVGEVFSTIKALAKDGMTMIIVTHQMGFAREVADQVIFMEKGAFVVQAPPGEFFGDSLKNKRIADFIRNVL